MNDDLRIVDRNIAETQQLLLKTEFELKSNQDILASVLIRHQGIAALVL